MSKSLKIVLETDNALNDFPVVYKNMSRGNSIIVY